MDSAVIFQIQSFLILCLLFVGVYFRKNRSKHWKIMTTAIAWDLILILQIEFTRSAIAKASKAASNPMLLNIHVSLAVSTVLLYFAMLYTGRKVLKEKLGPGDAIMKRHSIMGRLTILLRVLTFATSFMAVTPQS
jgi:uncharacterized membrane protein YozB (DUF420 family)